MKIFLATPYGFTESTRPFLETLRARLAVYGEVYNPFDNPAGEEFADVRKLDHYPDRLVRYADINGRIASVNEAALRETDLVVAALEGVEVDAGTAAEIGFAYALGKRVIGFRIDRRRAGENEACLVNLQVRWFIDRSGGTVVRSVDDLVAAVAAAATEVRRS
jgi:nucleoside 2-deoxyribosyltransferase